MRIQIVILLFLSSLFSCAFADTGMTEDEIEQWFNEDETLPVQVDEGELVFLPEAQKKPPLHSINELTIEQHSINNGWIKLVQCYKHLDPVAKGVVVYQYHSMKNLRIISQQNIQDAKINNQSIELENILPKAQLCIKADVKIFNRQPDGTYRLINGPYHRKFLDGYFPYHVTLTILYPESKLNIISTKPQAQPGFNINSEENKMIIDSVFAGKLTIEMMFEKRQ